MESTACNRFDPEPTVLGYFELTGEVTGEFANREKFVIKNISMGGLNIASNYPPQLGSSSQVFIHYGGERHAYRVRFVTSRIMRFQDQPAGVFRSGVVYSSGCQILFENDFQKSLVLGIIENDCRNSSVSGSWRAQIEMAASF